MTIQVLTPLSLEYTPDDPSHAVDISWVTAFVEGKIKAPVRLVATTNLAGSFTAGALQLSTVGHAQVDGISVALNDRLLLVGQTAKEQNGVYSVTNTGNGGAAEFTRADDFNTNDKVYTGVAITVREGARHGSTTWRLVTDPPITLNTTELEFIPVAPIAAASKYGTDIVGDNTKTEFEITHNLGTTDVSVAIRNLDTQGIVLTDVTVDDGNNVTVGFDKAPTTANHYRVVVLG